ncbi:tetratricopeptide repeat protein [Pararhodobacter sp. SW119]|uniref:tetratricopeptide repeat protein n=1 Tax=Pararhodobacter sp. SW119 TaxID=2780075 RepID=UPI001FD80AA7|nr:tetratricopeptide repeat protein [Pararhodobacter sp. SW119]
MSAGCTPRADFSPDGLPQSRLSVDEAVDGLVVGHRLMAAGEYELALRAYFRAAAEQGANADTLSAIGAANLRLGRLGQAEQALRRALERDPAFVPALNNLGVAMSEQERWGEARHLFQAAFALDSGRSHEIRDNLRLALAKLKDTRYNGVNENKFALVRRGDGRYLLLTTP